MSNKDSELINRIAILELKINDLQSSLTYLRGEVRNTLHKDARDTKDTRDTKVQTASYRTPEDQGIRAITAGEVRNFLYANDVPDHAKIGYLSNYSRIKGYVMAGITASWVETKVANND